MNSFIWGSGRELLVINDGSTVISSIKQEIVWLKIVGLEANFRRGKALRKGLTEATADIFSS
jgi:hypothetical protein